MTSHELARRLLEGADLPVGYINRDYERGEELVIVDEVHTIEASEHGPCCRQEMPSGQWERTPKISVIRLR